MKLILYMAISANGFIAKENGDSDWTSANDWNSYNEISTKIGNVIMGRKTYENLMKEKQFPLKNRLNIVMTKKIIKNDFNNVIFTNNSPQEVLRALESRGFKEAFLGGGGELNSSFAKEGLIDEIYLTISPIIFGEGKKLFLDADFELPLQLIEANKLSENEMQLHYKVVK